MLNDNDVDKIMNNPKFTIGSERMERIWKRYNEKLNEQEADAVITKPDGETFNIQFICVRCKRIAIFTNPFVKSPNSDRRMMQCDECGYSEFFIQAGNPV